MKATILAFDVGTSSVKSSLFDSDGHQVASASLPYGTLVPKTGYAEQNPQDWWDGIVKTTRMLAEKHPEAIKNIAAIGVSGHMLGCIPVDRDGKALYNAMIHSDSRAAKQYEKVCATVGADRMYRLTGNILDARSSLCKILWIKEEEPDIYRNSEKFLQSKDYIVAKLTGNIDTSDYSDACHGELMDIKKCVYDTAVFNELEIDMSKLPELHRSIDVVGTLAADSAAELGIPEGIPVIAGGGDGACAAAGSANTRPGDTYCCLGTTSWIAECTDSPFIDEKKRIFNLLDLGGDTYSVLGTTQDAGTSVTWLMDVLSESNVKNFDALAETVPAGSNGLVYIPYLDGERSPIFDTNARGIFFGLSKVHKREHFMRAALEGVAFALRSILDVLRERHPIEKMRIIGGGSNSVIWKRIISDVCNITLAGLSVPADDACSLGIAAAAGVGVGLFKDVAQGVQFIKETDVVEPHDPEKYALNYEVFSALYPATKDLMHRLADEN